MLLPRKFITRNRKVKSEERRVKKKKVKSEERRVKNAEKSNLKRIS